MGSRLRQAPDAKKALEVLLYVTAKVPDLYTALKIVYFADKKHLQRYGRLIYGEQYVAMRHGPVPSLAYHLLTEAQGRRYWPLPLLEEKALSLNNHTISPLRKPRLELLSRSDQECLHEAIEEFGNKTFEEIRNASHDSAFWSAPKNEEIDAEAIAKTLPNSDEVLEYLTDGSPAL